MDLKSIFTKKELPEEFLAVKISSTQVSAASWQVMSGKVEVGHVFESKVVENDLLKATDEAVSQVTHEPRKVIFGLPFHWVVEGQVIAEKLSLLRHLCKELDLKPEGFILLSEALENYCKEVEGAPLTAILAEFDGPDGVLTMYRAGKNLGSVPVHADRENINQELETGLKSLSSAEVFPSRIIICDGHSDLEKLAEKITSHAWTKNLPFLHFPKVEIFNSVKMVQVVAVAGGMQMGGHFEISMDPDVPDAPTPSSDFAEISAQEAGFFSDTGEPSEVVQDMPEPIFDDNVTPLPKPKIFEGIMGFLANIKLPKIKLSRPNFKSGGLIFGVVFGLGLLLGLGGYFLPKVTVILKISPPAFEHDVTVFVSTTGATSGSGLVVNGTQITVSEVGTQKSVATGHKLVGEKAKGTLTLYSAASSKSIQSGTVLTSSSGLKFTLDQTINIASGDAITRSTATGSVTATDIGDQYNLASGTKFSIGTSPLSDYAAQADSGLTGGNSHQAVVVTKEDQDRLVATLSAQLAERASSDLVEKLASGQNLLPNAITATVSKKKFSKNVGMEAETVNLDMTIEYSGIVFSKDDVVVAYSQALPENIPAGFALSGDRLNLDIKDIKTDKSGNSTLKIHLSSGLVSTLDTQKLVFEVSGKSAAAVTANLSKISGVSQVQIDTQPRVFAFLTQLFLPWNKNNIKFELVSQ